MEHAFCKLCGHRHPGLDHVWNGPSKKKEEWGPMPILPWHPKVKAAPVPVEPGKFDKNAYQKEYMREYRKRLKGERLAKSSAGSFAGSKLEK